MNNYNSIEFNTYNLHYFDEYDDEKILYFIDCSISNSTN